MCFSDNNGVSAALVSISSVNIVKQGHGYGKNQRVFTRMFYNSACHKRMSKLFVPGVIKQDNKKHTQSQ